MTLQSSRGTRDNAPLGIAMMCESDALGGAEMVILRLAQELSERGHRVVGVGPDEATQPDRGTNGWLRGKFADEGLEWHTYRQRRSIDPLCVKQLASIMTKARVRVVHSHEITMAIYGTAATKLAGPTHVISMHGNETVADTWKSQLALRWAIRHSSATIAVSEGTQARLQETLGLPAGKVHVIRNGVPARPGDRGRGRREVGADAGDLLVVAVGSLIPRKNHEILIRSLAELDASGTPAPWLLAIAGTGPEHARLENVSRELGVQDRVHLLGPRDDIPDLLAAADVFAMPSNWEGLPLALLEAMLAGKAIVATGVAGVPEAIEDGIEGLLVPPQDQARLTEALRILFLDERRRGKLGEAALRRAQLEFSIESMTDAYERLYTSES